MWSPAAPCRRSSTSAKNLQLDDFPYVHMMRRIDNELQAMGRGAGIFYPGEEPFIDGRDWGTLCATCSTRTITTL